MVVFDTTFLIPLLDPRAPEPIQAARLKIRHLINELEKAKEVIAIPTPALSELLTKAGAAGPEWIRILSSSARFRIVAFETLAAVEAALMTEAAIARGDKKSGLKDWGKVKFDRQIIAIARVTGSRCIYSHDAHFKTLVGTGGPQVLDLDDLPLPPAGAQIDMDEFWKSGPDGE